MHRLDRHKSIFGLVNLIRRTNNQKEIDMSIELKIKSKHLSVEAKIIRFEEQKIKKQIRRNKGNSNDLLMQLNSIADHRKYVVGRENRATFLARAFIAGTPYNKVEVKRRDDKAYEFNAFVIPRVLEMVKKYHPDYKIRRNLTKEDIIDWCC